MGAVFLEMHWNLLKTLKVVKNVSKMRALISSLKLHRKIPPGPPKIDQKLSKSGGKIPKNRQHCQKMWLFSVKKSERRKTRKKNEKKAKKRYPRGGGWRLNPCPPVTPRAKSPSQPPPRRPWRPWVATSIALKRASVIRRTPARRAERMA